MPQHSSLFKNQLRLSFFPKKHSSSDIRDPFIKASFSAQPNQIKLNFLLGSGQASLILVTADHLESQFTSVCLKIKMYLGSALYRLTTDFVIINFSWADCSGLFTFLHNIKRIHLFREIHIRVFTIKNRFHYFLIRTQNFTIFNYHFIRYSSNKFESIGS